MVTDRNSPGQSGLPACKGCTKARVVCERELFDSCERCREKKIGCSARETTKKARQILREAKKAKLTGRRMRSDNGPMLQTPPFSPDHVAESSVADLSSSSFEQLPTFSLDQFTSQSNFSQPDFGNLLPVFQQDHLPADQQNTEGWDGSIKLEPYTEMDYQNNLFTGDQSCCQRKTDTGEIHGDPEFGDQDWDLSADPIWRELIQGSMMSNDLNDHGTNSLNQAPFDTENMWTGFYEQHPDALRQDAKLMAQLGSPHAAQLPPRDIPDLVERSNSLASTVSFDEPRYQTPEMFRGQHSFPSGVGPQTASMYGDISPRGSQETSIHSHNTFKEDPSLLSTLPEENGAPFWTGLGFSTKEGFEDNLSALTAHWSTPSQLNM